MKDSRSLAKLSRWDVAGIQDGPGDFILKVAMLGHAFVTEKERVIRRFTSNNKKVNSGRYYFQPSYSPMPKSIKNASDGKQLPRGN